MNRPAAYLALAGASLALLLLLVLHALRPDLAPSSHVISEYAVGAHGWVMALAFLALGAGCAAAIVVLHRAASSLTGRIGLVLLGAAAVGLALAAFFPMDPIDVARARPTFSGHMHGVAAMIGNPGLMIGAVLLAIALRRHPDWAGVRVPLTVVTVLIWIAFGAMLNAMASMSQDGSDGTGIGWPNRVLWAAYCAWVVLAVWPAMRTQSHATEPA